MGWLGVLIEVNGIGLAVPDMKDSIKIVREGRVREMEGNLEGGQRMKRYFN